MRVLLSHDPLPHTGTPRPQAGNHRRGRGAPPPSSPHLMAGQTPARQQQSPSSSSSAARSRGGGQGGGAGSRTDPADVALSLARANTEAAELEGKLAAAVAAGKGQAMELAAAQAAQSKLAEKLQLGKPACPPYGLPAHTPARPPARPPARLSACLPVCLSACLPVEDASVCFFVCLWHVPHKLHGILSYHIPPLQSTANHLRPKSRRCRRIQPQSAIARPPFSAVQHARVQLNKHATRPEARTRHLCMWRRTRPSISRARLYLRVLTATPRTVADLVRSHGPAEGGACQMPDGTHRAQPGSRESQQGGKAPPFSRAPAL